jgi:hypothetical protein
MVLSKISYSLYFIVDTNPHIHEIRISACSFVYDIFYVLLHNAPLPPGPPGVSLYNIFYSQDSKIYITANTAKTFTRK